VFSWAFCDFGPEFEVLDSTGEEPKEFFLWNITKVHREYQKEYTCIMKLFTTKQKLGLFYCSVSNIKYWFHSAVTICSTLDISFAIIISIESIC